MKLAQVSLVILVGIETFCDKSAAIESVLRLPSHVCTLRAVWLLSAKVDIESLSLSRSFFYSLARLCGGLLSLSFAVIELTQVSW